MTYSISQTDPAQLSTEEIHEEIASFATLASEVVARWAVLLKELSKRRAPHPMFRHPVMQFWESIAECRLSPRAAVLLADRNRGTMIRAVLPLPIVEQEAIAEGREIPVAVQTDIGEIKSDNVPIHRMDAATMKRAFSTKGIRTVHEQAEIIRAEGKVERHGSITVDRTHGRLRIGNQTFTPDEFEAAFLALGYKIVLARDEARHVRRA